jgi:hypothetical protein
MRTTINLDHELLEEGNRITGVNRADSFDLRGAVHPERTRESPASILTRRQRDTVAAGSPAASCTRLCVLMFSSQVMR